jgi:uncharacterized protein YgfB (UPF0149 family)
MTTRSSHTFVSVNAPVGSIIGKRYRLTDLSALGLDASLTLSLSELHGVVCGIAVCNADDFELSTLVQLVGTEALADEESVGEFVEATITALLAEDMSFQVLLPEQAAPVAERAQALVEWSGAFVAGLGAALAESEMPKDTSEIVRDFIAVSELDADLEETDDSDQELAELEEFAKVGTLLIMDQLLAEHDA